MGEEGPPIPPSPPLGGDILPSSPPEPVDGDSPLVSPSPVGGPPASHLEEGSLAVKPSQSEEVEEEKAYSRQPWSGTCGSTFRA